MIVILLGSPGSGKGTQSKRLADAYGFKHLSTGDIFRAEIAEQTELGVKVQDYLKAGKLVPDAVVVEMVAGKIDFGGKYLLDGFPRTVEQAQALDRLLKGMKTSVDAVVYLTLSKEEAVRRMTSRRVCEGCGEVYNTISRPTAVDGVCDKCSGKVTQRADDSETTAQKRLMVFEDLTQPLVSYYKGESLLTEVDANREPAQVETALRVVIDELKAAR